MRLNEVTLKLFGRIIDRTMAGLEKADVRPSINARLAAERRSRARK